MYNSESIVRSPTADADGAYAVSELVGKYVESLQNDLTVKNNTSLYPVFIKRYATEKNIDLEAEYRKRPQSNHSEEIKSQFLRSQEHSEFAQFAELLPLLANKEGRLGKVCGARITKTAKPDDEGNSRVDLVCELSIDREFLKAYPELDGIRPTIAFFVDITTQRERFDAKEADFRKYDLLQGKKAEVLCYENIHKRLGIEFQAPKCLVLKQEDHLAAVAQEFRSAVRPMGDKGFVITNDRIFDKKYLEFFASFIESVRENMEKSAGFIKEQQQKSDAQKNLFDSYQTMVKFLEVYEKALGADMDQHQGP